MPFRSFNTLTSLVRSASRPFVCSTPPQSARFLSSTSATRTPWAEPLPKPIEKLNLYLAIVPDFPESKRTEIRGKHLEEVKMAHDMGWVVTAGALLEGEHGDSTPMKMKGSWFVLREESLEAARKRLERDLYATHGAWDMSKATIQSVAIALPHPTSS